MNCGGTIYDVFEETKEIEYVGERTVYGIVACVQEEGAGSREVLRVSDISTKCEVVEYLAQLCNRGALSPHNFMELLEDFWGI